MTDTGLLNLAVADAATAVAGALRPSHRRLLEAAGDPATSIARAMDATAFRDRVDPIWSARGVELTAALTTVCEVDERQASHLLAAALYAILLAGQDTASDAWLRLAERAACWDAGRHAATPPHA